MKRTQKNIVLILATAVFLLCTFLGLNGVLGKTFETKAQTNYVSPLPDGAYIADYTVLDVNAGALSGSTIKHNQEMGEATAVRTKITTTAGNTYNTYFGLFNTTSYYKGPNGKANYYIAFNKTNARTGTIDLYVNVGTGLATDVGKVLTFTHPAWLNLSTAGVTYNVETGAVRVLNESGTFIGTLIYMDVDDVRLVEYYYSNSGIGFSGNCFNYEANQTAGSLTAYDQKIDASGAIVTFSQSEYSHKDSPIPQVTLVTLKDGQGYGRTLAPSDFDITYTNKNNTGTATATLTFKGRYTGTATGTFKVINENNLIADNYQSKLPDGAYLEDYTVLDVAKEYGTNGVYTTTMSGDKGFALALNGASAYTFKFSQTKSPYSIRFGIFNNENGYLHPNNASANVDLRIGLLDVLPNETVHNKNFTMPTGVTYSMANVYEFGGIRVFNASGSQIGRLFYLEINGLRVLEYFFHYVGTDIFTNDYLTIHNTLSESAGESVVTLTSPETEDLTDNAGIKFGKSVVTDGKATPEVTVISSKTHGDTTYAKIIEKQYYDVIYTNNDKQGKATATTIFKGKYSGSVSREFDVVGIDLNTNVSELQYAFAMKGKSVTLGSISVLGRVFLGYDVDGVLQDTVTVEAVSGASVKLITVDFYTLDKASVRMHGTTGMRFLSSISTADKETLEKYGTVEFGTIVTSPDRDGYIDIKTENWIQSGSLVKEGRETFTAVITNFEGVGVGIDSYTTRYTARAYAKIKLDNGETKTVNAFVASDFTRSYSWLCASAIQSGEINKENAQYDYFNQIAVLHDLNAPDYSKSINNINIYAFYGPTDGRKSGGGIMGDGTDQRTLARYQEYKDAGFNVLLIENEAAYNGQDWATSDTKMVMDLCEQVGLKVIVHDVRMFNLARSTSSLIGQTHGGVKINSQADLNRLFATYMQDYQNHPAFYGVYVMDEPTAEQMPNCLMVVKAIKAVNPSAFVHLCLQNHVMQGFIPEYSEQGWTDVTYDVYHAKYVREDPSVGGNKYSPETDKKIVASTYISALEASAKLAKEKGVKVSAVTLQSFGGGESAHNGLTNQGWRNVDEYDMRYSAFVSLAYAPDYLVWFHYWASRYTTKVEQNPCTWMDEFGNKVMYDTGKEINQMLLKYGKVISNFEWQGTEYFTSQDEFPDYYNVDFSYKANGVQVSDVDGEMILSELYDTSKDLTGYMLVNSKAPFERKGLTATLKFDGKTHAVVYKNGDPQMVLLINGELKIDLDCAEGILILPFEAKL